MMEPYPVGTTLVINNPTRPLTRQRAVVVGYVHNAIVLRLVPDDEEGEQEVPAAEGGIRSVDDGHLL